MEGGTLVTARDSGDEEDNDELRKLETRMRSDAEARQSLLQKVVAMHAPSSTLMISHNSRRLQDCCDQCREIFFGIAGPKWRL